MGFNLVCQLSQRMLWLHACILLRHNVLGRYKLNYVFAGLQTLLMAIYNYMYFSINYTKSLT